MSKNDSINVLKNADLSEKSAPSWNILIYHVQNVGIEIIRFGYIEIEKHKFHRYKNPIFENDVDISNISISTGISSSEMNY